MRTLKVTKKSKPTLKVALKKYFKGSPVGKIIAKKQTRKSSV